MHGKVQGVDDAAARRNSKIKGQKWLIHWEDAYLSEALFFC